MTEKASPGPWAWDHHTDSHYKLPTLMDANGEGVLDLGEAMSCDGWGFAPGKADADLMAASPDLRDVCFAVVQYLNASGPYPGELEAMARAALEMAGVTLGEDEHGSPIVVDPE